MSAQGLPGRWLGAFWRGFRQWCGDSDYDRYLRVALKRAAHIGRVGEGEVPGSNRIRVHERQPRPAIRATRVDQPVDRRADPAKRPAVSRFEPQIYRADL